MSSVSARLMRRVAVALAVVAGLIGGAVGTIRADSPQRPILFVHGDGDSAALWTTIIWRFESAGYDSHLLFAVDLPHPLHRDDDTKPQVNRSSTTEAATDLGAMTARELQQIEGVGKSTAEKIRELLEKGKVEKLEGLRQKHPRSVVELLRIQGLGPKALKRLRAELGVQSIDDLRRVLVEQKLRALTGFGQKSEEKLAQALARLEAQGPMERTTISVALPLAERIVAHMLELPGVTHASTCGSLRRFAKGSRRAPSGSPPGSSTMRRARSSSSKSQSCPSTTSPAPNAPS